MATHSSVLAWRIPGMGEPGGLPPMGSHRVGHDWSDLAAAAAAAAAGMFSVHNGKEDCGLVPKRRESHSFFWVHIANLKGLMDSNHPCQGDGVHWVTSIMVLLLRSGVGKIPWMEEPGRLQSMVSLRVRRDWMTSLSLFTFMHWRRKWQPTPVFLPGESQGLGSLVGCRLWGRTESDTTEVT